MRLDTGEDIRAGVVVSTADIKQTFLHLLEPDAVSERFRERVAGFVLNRFRGDAALLELLYGCGLRAAEACALRIGDVRIGEGDVRVTGKGDRQRVLPLGRGAAEAATGLAVSVMVANSVGRSMSGLMFRQTVSTSPSSL